MPSESEKVILEQLDSICREEYEAACKEDPEFAEEITFEEFKSEVFVENISGRN
jgi:hypothetical protein